MTVWQRVVAFSARCHDICLLVCVAEGVVFVLILAVMGAH